MTKSAFSRGLDQRFLHELKCGMFAPVLEAVNLLDCDVQIREGYLDVYSKGRCILSLAHSQSQDRYRARIHHKYLLATPLQGLTTVTSDNYVRMAANAEFTDWYLNNLNLIWTNAGLTAKDEATVEESMIRLSYLLESPVVFIDRQVQLHGVRLRMDLLGIELNDGFGPKVLLTEVKQGLDNRIQDLVKQTGEYFNLIAPDGFLRDDVSRSYQLVLEQKRDLGLLKSKIQIPGDQLSVECLLVLYDYNDRSQLLDRLRHKAKDCSLPLWLVRLPKGSFAIPSRHDWEALW